MIGPGKYDDECTAARESTGATGVVLIVLNGDRGDGFSAQLPGEKLSTVPQMLRSVADQMQQDFLGAMAVPHPAMATTNPANACRVCGCTEDDCSQCTKKTGHPCHWVDDPAEQGLLCSACEPLVWGAALDHFSKVRAEYLRLKGTPGVNTSLALEIVFMPLTFRWEFGERSPALYKEMMSVQ